MRMKRAGKNIATLVMVLLLALTVACAPLPEEVTSPLTPAVERGIIEIRVTDPPPPGVENAIVTVTKIEVHRVWDEEGAWETIFEDADGVTFDLVKVFENPTVIAYVEVMVGGFTQIRMEVTEVVVTPVGGDPVSAIIPSGELKIVRPFNVEAGMRTILTLDFDGDKSIKIKTIGGKDEFLFNPVVKLLIEKQKVE